MGKVVLSGAINWDYNLFVERFPEPGEEVPVLRFEQVPGGKGANASVSASFFLEPGSTSFIGALGDDDVGKKQVALLEESGVNPNGVKIVSGVPSGQAYITIENGGQNTISTVFGANTEIKPEDMVESPRRQLITEADCVGVVDPPIPALNMLVSLAGQGNARVAWDIASHSQRPIDELSKALESTDYLIMNEVEAKLTGGSHDPALVRQRLAEYNPDISVIVKLGANGCHYSSPEQGLFVPGIPLEAFGLKVVNTTGAGDAFMGGFVAAIAEGGDIVDALAQGNAAGADKVTMAHTRLTGDIDELRKLVFELMAATRERVEII